MSNTGDSSNDSSNSSPTVSRRTVGSFVLGSISTAGVILGTQQLTSTDSDQEGAGPDDIQILDRPFLGRPSSTATAVYYMDFQCPYCKQFERQTLPQINQNFTSSDLNIVIKPVSVFGDDSKRAARAAHSGWEQLQDPAAYWKWHNELKRRHNNSDGSGWATTENLVDLAESFDGVDAKRFQTNHAEGTYNRRAINDKSEGREHGMTGTPHFVIYGEDPTNQRTVSGAQPYSKFEAAINELL